MMRGSDCTLRDRANNERGGGRMKTGGRGVPSQIQYVARIVVVVVAGDVLMMLSSCCCCCCRLVAESHGTETNFRQRVNTEESEKQMQ